jgi:type II secretory pathway component PulF
MDLSLDALKTVWNNFATVMKRRQFSNKKQLAFLEDLYTLINDGIPANRAVDMMAQVSQGLTRDVASSLSKHIAQGQPLADGMSEWFSSNVVEIVRVGEAGGALAQTLKSAINLLSQSGVAYGGFISAITYPLFVIVMGCGVIVYLDKSVFDQFRAIKPIETWPTAGQQVVYISQFITQWWWSVILGIIILIIILSRLMKNYVGELRPMLDNIPPFSFYKKFAAARLLETLGLLVSNGVVFKSAIKIMQQQSTPYLHHHLVITEHLLSMGRSNIADVLATGLISDADLMRLRVMAEVKGFEHGLIRMGIRGTELATATIKTISRIIGGILLAIGGILIIIIIRGIFMTGMAMGSIT